MRKNSKEYKRVLSLTVMEEHARFLGYQHIAGVDEAGRGPLAGPVVAAACVIPQGILIEGINDSKQVLPEAREKIYQQILSLEAIDYGIGIIEPAKIDQINILRATFEAMLAAIAALKCKPDYLLVDGLHLPTPHIPGIPVVEGDGKSQSIAAASIVAKVTRDRIMQQLHVQWPQYSFSQNKGYGTAEHLEAIQKYGPCPIHRMSFEPLKSLHAPRQLEFF
jgi:ribonuclease HII